MRADGKQPVQPQVEDKGGNSFTGTIHNIVVLDSSGSMRGGKYDNAISGTNELINTITQDTDNTNTLSIIEFDTRIKWHRKFTSIFDTFYSNCFGGMTALYDAIGQAINEAYSVKKSEDKVLITIFTDGQNNHSREYTQSMIKTLIENGKSHGFTVAFVGTEFDTEKAIKDFGILKSNTMTYDGTARGLGETFRLASESRFLYSKKVAKGEDVSKDFFTKSVEQDNDNK